MLKEELWNLYLQSDTIKSLKYEAWCFGGEQETAKELAALVVKGILY